MGTAKRERQKAGRQARLAAEQKTKKRKQLVRRLVTVVIAAAVVVGISIWAFGGSSKSTSTTTTTRPTTATTKPPASGGSGNTSPAAITTSADCPTSLSATLNKPRYASYPPVTVDPSKTYTATVTTDVGAFTIHLEPNLAPKAVNSFVFLAEHHFFDCIVFHRVIPGFVDQTGDPTGTGSGGPGYSFADELPAKATPQYPLGSVAMANSGPNTNGSQWFVVTGTSGEQLAPSYSLFGQVTSGMSVVQRINADGQSSGTPKVLHRMISVTIAVS